jgi:hypothetical protein
LFSWEILQSTIQTGVNTGADIVTATLFAADYADPDPVLVYQLDVALLKIMARITDLPLGKIDDISVGSNVLLVGFPGSLWKHSMLLILRPMQNRLSPKVVSAFKQAKEIRKP